MSRGFCPSCHQPVRLPSLPRQTRVRCPLCRAEHLAGAFADEGPPIVEVVEAITPTGPPSSSAPPGRTSPDVTAVERPAVPPTSASAFAAGKPRVDAVEPVGSSSTHETARPDVEQPEPPKTASGTTEQPRYAFRETLPSPAEMAPLILASGKHTPRREPGAIAWLTKVILGGLAGAILAQLIVWWLPQPYRRDPLNLAPKIPPQFGWLAPDELRWPLPSDSASGESWNVNSGADDAASPTSSSTAGSGENNSAATGSSAGQPQAADAGTESASGESSSTAAKDATAAGGAAGDASASGSSDSLPAPGDPQAANADPSTAPQANVGLRRADVFSGVEIAGAYTDAQAARTRWEAALEPQRAGLSASWMRTWEELAYRLTFANENDPGVSEPLANIEGALRQAWADPVQQEVWLLHQRQVWSNLNAWPAGNKYTGRFLLGKVIEVTPRGPLYRSLIQLAGSDLAVPVYSRVNPSTGAAPAYMPGDTVAILGVVVRDPERDLEGFEGTDRPIVWGGLPVKLNQTSGTSP